MDLNFICRGRYDESNIIEVLTAGLKQTIRESPEQLVMMCIGTDAHIGDSLGPLVGTLLIENGWKQPIYGTLNNPLHARNLSQELGVIRNRHPGCLELAVDASLGKKEEMGVIEIRRAGFFPGSALAKRLPQVGQVSIIGKVGAYAGWRGKMAESRLGMVYLMARTISRAILEWESGFRN